MKPSPLDDVTLSPKQQQEQYWAERLRQEGLALLEASNEDEAALVELLWQCGVCMQNNTLLLEALEGETQQHMQDCATCCHPHQLDCWWQEEGKQWHAETAPMNRF